MKEKDRRINKTNKAIFEALEQLLTIKSFSKISVREIIDIANVGRSTFYNHFETKDILFEKYLETIFDELKVHASFDLKNHTNVPVSGILIHIKKNRNIIMRLFSDETSEIISNKFRSYWNQSAETFINTIIPRNKSTTIPRELLTNYITSSLIDIIKWWLVNNMPYSPEQMEKYWLDLIKPALISQLESE